MEVQPVCPGRVGTNERGRSMSMKVSSARGEKCWSGIFGRLGSLNGSCAGYPATNRGWATSGVPPTALSRFAASVRCSISSRRTLRMVSWAWRLVPGLMVYIPLM